MPARLGTKPSWCDGGARFSYESVIWSHAQTRQCLRVSSSLLGGVDVFMLRRVTDRFAQVTGREAAGSSAQGWSKESPRVPELAVGWAAIEL